MPGVVLLAGMSKADHGDKDVACSRRNIISEKAVSGGHMKYLAEGLLHFQQKLFAKGSSCFSAACTEGGAIGCTNRHTNWPSRLTAE